MNEDTKLSEDTNQRKFLVVVDDSPECKAAIYFAARRAFNTGGRVTLLYVIVPTDFEHWQSVKEVMEDEAREQAEEVLQDLSKDVQAESGSMPELVIRQGQTKEQLDELLKEDPDIKILVLGAASGGGNPGPLVSSIAKGGFMDNSGENIAIPVTIVPGHLSRAEIDALT